MKKAKVSKYGQWKYPGQDTIIPNANGSITMKGVPYPVLGIDDQGNQQMMMPGAQYQFPGNSVYEIPMVKNGGTKKVKIKSLPKAQIIGGIEYLGDVTEDENNYWDQSYNKWIGKNLSPEDAYSAATADVNTRRGPSHPYYVYNANSGLPNENSGVIVPVEKPNPYKHLQDWPNFNESGSANDFYGNTDDTVKWEKKWYSERAKLPQFTDIAEKRLSLANNIDMQPWSADNWQNSLSPYATGYYSWDDATVNIPQPYFSRPSLYTHERSHWYDYNAPQDNMVTSYYKGKPIPLYNEYDPILNNIIPEEYMIPGGEGATNDVYSKEGIYSPFTNDDPNYDVNYYYNPTEVRARLNEWRRRLNIDPTKNYSNDEIQQIIDKDINSGDRGSFDLYKVLRGRGDLLKQINDSYVSTGDKENPDEIPKAKKGGTKKVKIHSLPKAQYLGELTPEQRKVYDNRYIYNREHGFDTQESNDSALQDAQYSNTGPIYNFQPFLPDPDSGVRIASGKRFPLEYIDWNTYKPFDEAMYDPDFTESYYRADPELQGKMKDQVESDYTYENYYNSLDDVKAWEKSWYTKRAQLPQFTDIANKRLSLIDNVNMQPITKSDFSYMIPGAGAAYTHDKNSVLMPTTSWLRPSAFVHERSHWFDWNAPQNNDMYNGSYFRSYLKPGSIPSPVYNYEDEILTNIIPSEYKLPYGVVDPLRLGENDTNTYDSETEKILVNRPKASDNTTSAKGIKLPFKGKENVAGTNNINYYYTPTEVRARLNEWRFDHNIDPTKEYTNEEIQKIIDDDIENKNESNFDFYKIIRGRGDLLKQINDSYVSTGDKENPDEIPKAKRGLRKAQDGLPADYESFLKYSETAPENRRPDSEWQYGNPRQYDHYGMWDALGKPENFNQALEKNPQWQPDPYDNMYHGFSTNPNTGVWLKSHIPGESHPGDTGWMEYKDFMLSNDRNWGGKNQNLVYDPDLQRMRYVDRKKAGGVSRVQKGGPSYQLPPQYRDALQNFVYPIIDETDEYTGYNPLQGQINQDTRPGSIENNDWWMQHELLHHLQNLSGGMSSLGPLGKRPNLTTASNEAIEGYYNRRDNDVNRTIDNMIAQDPSLQFIPRDKLRNGSEPDENGHLSFVGAENLQYADPSTLEGEARQYEQYIRNGNPSIFPKKQNGGPAYDIPKQSYRAPNIVRQEGREYYDPMNETIYLQPSYPNYSYEQAVKNHEKAHHLQKLKGKYSTTELWPGPLKEPAIGSTDDMIFPYYNRTTEDAYGIMNAVPKSTLFGIPEDIAVMGFQNKTYDTPGTAEYEAEQMVHKKQGGAMKKVKIKSLPKAQITGELKEQALQRDWNRQQATAWDPNQLNGAQEIPTDNVVIKPMIIGLPAKDAPKKSKEETANDAAKKTNKKAQNDATLWLLDHPEYMLDADGNPVLKSSMEANAPAEYLTEQQKALKEEFIRERNAEPLQQTLGTLGNNPQTAGAAERYANTELAAPLLEKNPRDKYNTRAEWLESFNPQERAIIQGSNKSYKFNPNVWTTFSRALQTEGNKNTQWQRNLDLTEEEKNRPITAMDRLGVLSPLMLPAQGVQRVLTEPFSTKNFLTGIVLNNWYNGDTPKPYYGDDDTMRDYYQPDAQAMGNLLYQGIFDPLNYIGAGGGNLLGDARSFNLLDGPISKSINEFSALTPNFRAFDPKLQALRNMRGYGAGIGNGVLPGHDDIFRYLAEAERTSGVDRSYLMGLSEDDFLRHRVIDATINNPNNSRYPLSDDLLSRWQLEDARINNRVPLAPPPSEISIPFTYNNMLVSRSTPSITERLFGRISDRVGELSRIRTPGQARTFMRNTFGKTSHPKVVPVNKSLLGKTQTKALLKDKSEIDKLEKLSDSEFRDILITPDGRIKFPEKYTGPKQITKVETKDWVEEFNGNLDLLNRIIAENNTSGREYWVTGITEDGLLKFRTADGRTSTMRTDITPGKFKGEVQDIADETYMVKEIPGIQMSGASPIFGDAVRGTGTYKSLNEYLKKMELGRVKSGMNVQSNYSRPLWENAIKKGDAFGFYASPGTVYGIMKKEGGTKKNKPGFQVLTDANGKYVFVKT